MFRKLLSPLSGMTAASLRRHRRGYGMTATALVCFAGYHYAIGQETTDTFKFGRDAQQGRKIAPVPLNMQGKSPELVYLGSYIVNGNGGCNSCHTCPTYKAVDPFKRGSLLGPAVSARAPVNTANHMSGGTPFPGRALSAKGSTLSAPNLTPDRDGLPGGLTYDEFKNAMQNGELSSEPGHILQVMPWPSYRNLHEQDLVAIYQYLSAIPPAKPGICGASDETGN